jgi:hypothetical protein
MNSATTRQQSNQRNAVQRVRVAAPKAVTPANRQRAVRSLVRCLETNPRQQEWSETTNSVLLGLWPNFMTSNDELISALDQWTAIIMKARAIVRAKLGPDQLIVLDATNHHQAAVNSLLELSVEHPPGAPLAVPFEEVPALFRTAIQEDRTAGTHSEETDLIEHALMLIDRNGGDATIRTPDQEQFYADLLMSWDADGQVRITYSPSNVTVH